MYHFKQMSRSDHFNTLEREVATWSVNFGLFLPSLFDLAQFVVMQLQADT